MSHSKDALDRQEGGLLFDDTGSADAKRHAASLSPTSGGGSWAQLGERWAKQQARQWRMWLLVGIALNVTYAYFVHIYVDVVVEPLPRGTLNITFGRWKWFCFLSTIIGLATGIINSSFVAGGLALVPVVRRARGVGQLLAYGGIGLVWFSLVLYVMHAPGRNAHAPLLKSYNHYCDGDWIEVLFNAHVPAYGAPASTALHTATFTLVKTREPLFVFTSPLDRDDERFQLATLGSTGAKPPSILPELQLVTFEESYSRFNGSCYRPPGAPPLGVNDTSCHLEGTYWPWDGISFTVSLNKTRTRTRNAYPDYSFADVPQLLMHRVNWASALAERQLQSSMPNPADAEVECTQMKVCVAQAAWTPHSRLDSEFLVPIGWLLRRHVDHAHKCLGR